MSTKDTVSRNINVGLQGFKCPLTNYEENKSFDYCLMECPTPCLSVPMLYVIAQTRGIIEKRYSVTEILNPYQQVYLKRNNPYWVDPTDRTWMTLGTGFHKVIEEGLTLMPEDERKHYASEKEGKFELDFGYATLSGIPDLYDKRTKTLTDFKTMKVYAMKKLMEGDWSSTTYGWQINMYRAFAFPEAEYLEIEAFLKDWNAQTFVREGIKPYEKIRAPLMNIGAVEEHAQDLLQTHTNIQSYKAKLPPCPREDLWIPDNPRNKNCGVPLRCRDYCECVDVCSQAQSWKNKNGGWKERK